MILPIQYPTAIDDDQSLLIAANRVASSLTADVDSTQTSIFVNDASEFPDYGYALIEEEIIQYTGKSGNTLTGVTRGWDSSFADSHSKLDEEGEKVFCVYINTAEYHEQLKDAIVAVETELGLEPKGTDASVRARLDRLDAEEDPTLEAVLDFGNETGDNAIVFDEMISPPTVGANQAALYALDDGGDTSIIVSVESSSYSMIIEDTRTVIRRTLQVNGIAGTGGPIVNVTASANDSSDGDAIFVLGNDTGANKLRLRARRSGYGAGNVNDLTIQQAGDIFQIRGGFGTITEWDGDTGALTHSSSLTINAPDVTTVPFVINGAVGQTAEYIEIYDNSGNNIMDLTDSGWLRVTGRSDTPGAIYISSQNSDSTDASHLYMFNDQGNVNDGGLNITRSASDAANPGVAFSLGDTVASQPMYYWYFNAAGASMNLKKHAGDEFADLVIGDSVTNPTARARLDVRDGDVSIEKGQAFILDSNDGANSYIAMGATDDNIEIWHNGFERMRFTETQVAFLGVDGFKINGINPYIALEVEGEEARSVIQYESANNLVFGTDDASNVNTVRIRIAGEQDETQVAIGGNVVADCILALNSTDGAFLPPRMTTVQRDALVATAGMTIFNTTVGDLQVYDGVSWESGTADSLQEVTDNGNTTDNDIIIDSTGATSDYGTYYCRSANPGLWLEENETTYNLGCYIVLDQDTLQFQRRTAPFGAFEAAPFRVNMNAPWFAFNINATGQVGVKAEASEALLHVTGNADDEVLAMFEQTTDTHSARMKLKNDAGYEVSLNCTRSGSGGTLGPNAGYINMSANSAFRIDNNGATNRLLHINATGEVGIGNVPSPSHMLDVQGGDIAIQKGQALIFDSDSGADTYIGTGATDNDLEIWRDGSERFRLTDTRAVFLECNSVSVNSTNPAFVLEVEGEEARAIFSYQSGPNDLIIETDDSGGTSNGRIYIAGEQDADEVGVGFSPQSGYTLAVKQNVLIREDTSNPELRILSASASLMSMYSSEGSVGTPTTSGLNKFIGVIDGYGYGDTGFVHGARIAMSTDATSGFSDASAPTTVYIQTSDVGSTTPTTRFLIASDGQSKFSDSGSFGGGNGVVSINSRVGGIGEALTLENTLASIAGRGTDVVFRSSDTDFAIIRGSTVTGSDDGQLKFYTKSAAATDADLAVTIDEEGYFVTYSGFAVNRTASAGDVNADKETIIGVTDTSIARTVTIPTTGIYEGQIYIIKDESGAAGTNNITVQTDSPTASTIDGSSSVAISTNYGVLRIYSDGTDWFSF